MMFDVINNISLSSIDASGQELQCHRSDAE